jgi:hypothetical protein
MLNLEGAPFFSVSLMLYEEGFATVALGCVFVGIHGCIGSCYKFEFHHACLVATSHNDGVVVGVV